MGAILQLEETTVNISRSVEYTPNIGETVFFSTIYDTALNETEHWTDCIHVVKDRRLNIYDGKNNFDFLIILDPCANDRIVYPFIDGKERTTNCALRILSAVDINHCK